MHKHNAKNWNETKMTKILLNLSPEINNIAKKKAEKLGISKSEYIRSLIYADNRKNGTA